MTKLAKNNKNIDKLFILPYFLKSYNTNNNNK